MPEHPGKVTYPRSRLMESRTFRRSAVALAIAGAFAIGVTTADKVSMHAANAAVSPPTVSTPAISAPSNVAPVAALPDFSGLVEKYGPAVVNISVTSDGRKLTADEDSSTPDMDQLPPFLRDSPFFRNLPTPQQRGPMRGMGSGFIVSSDGVILTNAHVVANADEVTVTLTDRRQFKAKVLGCDKTTHIDALKIDAKNLPVVKIGDPAQTRVGEWVVAIGQPYGFENTVTAGIVSAKARALPQDSYVPFIQTDAAVNPGNSGGPLFNTHGEVIGINSQIYTRTGGYQGLSFAIPINTVQTVSMQLEKSGHVSRGWLGVQIQTVNSDLAKSFGMDKPRGALVGNVDDNSPAGKAGVQTGDIIVSFDGHAVESSSELPPLVGSVPAGHSVEMKVLRDGKEIT